MTQRQTARGGRSTSDRKSTASNPNTEKKPSAQKSTRQTGVRSASTRQTGPKSAASRRPANGDKSTSEPKPSAAKKTASARPSGEKRQRARAKDTPDAPAKPRRRVTKRPEITRRESATQRARQVMASVAQTLRNPAFWRRMAQRLPPWMDEVGAILLIVWGVVMLTALLNSTSEAMLAVTLSRILRQLFGYGAYLVSLAVLAAGVILLLPKFGITLRIGWTRAIALETAFGAFVALTHLLANDPQPHALAREGGGGGYLGWALSGVSARLLGHSLSIALFGVALCAGLIVTAGLRFTHVSLAIAWLRAWLQRGITRLDALSSESEHDPDADVEESGEAENPGGPQASVNPAPEETTPPVRPTKTGPPRGSSRANSNPGPISAVTGADPKVSDNSGETTPNDPPPRALSKIERRELIERTRQELGAANGRSLVSPGEPGARKSVVPRQLLPDARVIPDAPRARIRRKLDEPTDRHFTVEDFREVKKIGKRDDHLPALDLLSDVELNKPTEEEINTNAQIIRHTLLEFDVETEVIDVKIGPTVTQYAVSPYTERVNDDGERVLNRVRVSEIANLGGDLALALSAKRLRIQAPVPGHSYVGIEVPNRQPSSVALRPVLESEQFYRHRDKPLALPLGRDVSGEPFIADLGVMPHLLIAGTTGSGKSIMLAAMTTAFVMNNPPDVVRLALLDPKMVELSRFNGLPHLLGPVETELDRIIGVLRWATREMDRRYKLLEKEAARNLEVYNKGLGRRRKDERLPYIVMIIDEIGDLMMQRPDETERALTRLAQMARAVGIHLMVATQRPSVDVITGLIKANFPARISFAVASGVDSRVILDYTGAESLMGRGDMLFLAPDAAGPQRLQGCYVSDEEVNAVVDYWKRWRHKQIEVGAMEERPVAPWERGMTRREVLAETDPMLEEAIALVIAEGEASASLIQRRLGLGYPRAARIMDLLAELGVVGAARPGGRSREVLFKPGTDPFKKIVDKRLKSKK